MEPMKIVIEDIEAIPREDASVQLDGETYETKGELLEAFRTVFWGLVVDIREYTAHDEPTPTNKTPPDVFSLLMGEPPEEIMPIIRASLAFIHDDDDTYAILGSLTWDSGKYVNLVDFARMREKNFGKLHEMIKNPEQKISHEKIETLKLYLEKHKDAVEYLNWKSGAFFVPLRFWKLITKTISIMELIWEKWPQTVEENLGDQLQAGKEDLGGQDQLQTPTDRRRKSVRSTRPGSRVPSRSPNPRKTVAPKGGTDFGTLTVPKRSQVKRKSIDIGSLSMKK